METFTTQTVNSEKNYSGMDWTRPLTPLSKSFDENKYAISRLGKGRSHQS